MFKAIALALLKGALADWLTNRALKVPASKEATLAAQAGVSVDALRACENVLSSYAVTQMGTILR